MKCWNCHRDLPSDAKVCGYCEAAVMEEPSAEEIEMARALLESMPADVMAEFAQVMESSATAEEFADRIFVGDCPKCNSSKTGNCENDPEIGELLVGRCYDCGQLWCTECQKLLTVGNTTCECWDEDPFPEGDELDENELDDEELDDDKLEDDDDEK